MELLRARREPRFRLELSDPQPLQIDSIWSSASHIATVGIFILLLCAALYFARGLLLPVVVAILIGETLAPLVSKAADRGVPRVLSAAVLVCGGLALLGLTLTLLAGPVSDIITRAPEIGASIRQKLYVFDRPLAAWHDLQAAVMPRTENTVQVETGWASLLSPVMGFLTPTAGQLMLFVIVLFFVLAGGRDVRNFIATSMPSREAKLRFLRIINDIRHNLAGYVAVVSAINAALGLIVGIGAWLLGFPSPVLIGVLAAVLNYIPYIGPAVTALILFAVGVVIFPTLGQALIAPAGFVVIASIEGHLITPAILGRRLTLNPLAIILALAFWSWMWGPMGAFIAAPMSIVGLVIIGHLFPSDDPRLPA